MRKRGHDWLADILSRVDAFNYKTSQVDSNEVQGVPRHGMPQLFSGGRCRNRDCSASMFTLSHRDGDMVCDQCGVVQNMYSLESQEEKNPIFSDADKNVSRARAEVFECLGLFPSRFGMSSDDMDMMFEMARCYGFADADLMWIFKDVQLYCLSLREIKQLFEEAARSSDVQHKFKKPLRDWVTQEQYNVAVRYTGFNNTTFWGQCFDSDAPLQECDEYEMLKSICDDVSQR